MTNEKEAMEGLLARAVKICTEPIDDRENRPDHLPSLRAIAEELEVTTIKARKLLITAGYFSSITSREVKRLSDNGLSPKQIGERLGLGPAAVYGYLPYKTVAYSLDEISANASRHKRYRDRAEAVKELLNRILANTSRLTFWSRVILRRVDSLTSARRQSSFLVMRRCSRILQSLLYEMTMFPTPDAELHPSITRTPANVCDTESVFV